MATVPTVKLKIAFHLENTPPDFVVIDKTDYTLYGAGTVDGLLKIVGPDGLVFYENAGYATAVFTSPDITGAWNGGDAVLLTANIVLPLDTDRGSYTFYLKVKSSENAGNFTGEQTIVFDAVMPVADITMAVDVDTSTMVVTDDSEYTITNDGEEYDPISTVYDTDISFPVGSNVADVNSTTKAKTVTPIYTKVFTANLSTTVTYSIPSTDTSNNFTVTYLNLGVETTPEITWTDITLAYYSYSKNLFDRYVTARDKGPAGTLEKLKRALTELSFYWVMYKQAKQFGEDFNYWADRIAVLLTGENYVIPALDDALPIEIVPVTQVLGTGNTYVGSVWLTGTIDPADGVGANGDFYLQTVNGVAKLAGDVFHKASGTWGSAIFNIKGATGTAGADGADGADGVDAATWLTGALDPNNANGANGDFYFQSVDGVTYLAGDIFQKAAGVWGTPIINISGAAGAAGADGADGNNEIVFHNDLDAESLVGVGIETALMFYEFTDTTYNGDVIVVTALFQLAVNARTKIVGLKIDTTSLITKQTAFENRVEDENTYILLRAEINRRAAAEQLVNSYGFHRDITNGHDFVSNIVEATINMVVPFTIKAVATGTVAGDIICRELTVEYKKKRIVA